MRNTRPVHTTEEEPVPDAQVDVAVIGAGIVGAACAYRLAEAGLRVLVLERGEAPATGSTGWSAAGVRVQFTDPVNIALSLASIGEFTTFEESFGIDSGYRAIGYLLLVPEEQWEQHLVGVERQHAAGAPVEVLSVEDVRRRFCAVDGAGLAGATFGPIDGVIDPHAVTVGYLDAARSLGAQVRLYTAVTAIERRSERWELTAGTDTVTAGTVVNATGAWAGEVARLAGLEVPVQPVRRTVFATAPLADRPTQPLTVDLSSGVWFRPEGQRLIFGRSDPNETPGFTEGVDWDALEPTLMMAAERFPWFLEESLDRGASWFGYYEETPDHNPILGRHRDEPSWVDACGFSGHGVQQAPAVGRAITEEIVGGRSEWLDIDPLRGDRFERGAAGSERHVI
jgi:sarcosine oxidase, subunit beta